MERATPAGVNAELSDAKPPSSAALLVEMRSKVVNNVLGSMDSVRKEIDDALADMRVFHQFEPDRVMTAVSAHSARMVEIIVQISRIEVTRREWKPVREEAEKVLGEMKSQFQVASRQTAMRQLDYQMSGGQV